MQLRRWSVKRISLVVSACLLLYVIFAGGYRKYEIDTVIDNTRPQEVWDYVADFGRMRLLNPTIIDFKILSDSGNTHNWRYMVEYTERLSHWPHWLNTAHADYTVTQSLPGVTPTMYAIESRHKTCFLSGIYCLRATSEFQFSARNEGTYCRERIQYQCPPFLGGACRSELEYQRKAVIHNLTTIFSKQRSHT